MKKTGILGVKRAVLVPLRAKAGAIEVPFRVLSRKYLTGDI